VRGKWGGARRLAWVRKRTERLREDMNDSRTKRVTAATSGGGVVASSGLRKAAWCKRSDQGYDISLLTHDDACEGGRVMAGRYQVEADCLLSC
jgi:hypothetical protein